MRRRHGFTLIEVLTATTVGSLVLGLAAGLLYTMFRTDRSARDRLQRSVALSRLSDQFRRDVHAATAQAELEGAAGRVFRLPGDRAIMYRMAPGGLVRIEREGDSVRRQETFSLSPSPFRANPTAWFEIRDGQMKIVSLVIRPRPAGDPASDLRPGQASGPAVRIDAALARDHRFVRSRLEN